MLFIVRIAQDKRDRALDCLRGRHRMEEKWGGRIGAFAYRCQDNSKRVGCRFATSLIVNITNRQRSPETYDIKFSAPKGLEEKLA